MDNERRGDLIISQGEFVLVQDGTNGQVEVIVGPHKISLSETDKTVIYDEATMRFETVQANRAIQSFSTAKQGQYIELRNPVAESEGKHPSKGKEQSPKLYIGSKVNIPGPVSFPLYPGQVADVIDGHQLKSNEYLLVRVYNEEAAKKYAENAIVIDSSKGKESEADKKKSSKKESSAMDANNLVTGKLMIIRGTEVSFYIPPTGIEVLKNEKTRQFKRDAVTLERLEYCILLDENGDKRFVIGPDVVFPKPTEHFMENNSSKKFRAIELNENMGIYIKVIADYEEAGEKFKAGEELFITGKEQKIYYPRPEHAIIKYGDSTIHYAVALPSGEARYVLDKNTGDVNTVKGPKMLLPDPRSEVIVKRVLDMKECTLYYPGNDEALHHNMALMNEEFADLNDDHNLSHMYSANMRMGGRHFKEQQATLSAMDYAAEESGEELSRVSGGKLMSKSAGGDDKLSRKTKHTKPRTITLDTKFDGAVTLNVWPGFAIQKVKRTGEREVVQGPKVVILEYDETLETLELSTSTPKTDKKLLKTVYLQTENNIVSDIVNAETEDLVEVAINLSFRVKFTGDETKWFSVSNYVKLLTQHLRSLIRNEVKKHKIEAFYKESTDLIRDAVLGTKGEKRSRDFAENNMSIYDVEVLGVEIDDEEIDRLIKDSQLDTVRTHLNEMKLDREVNYEKKKQKARQEEMTAKRETEALQASIELEAMLAEHKQSLEELESQKKEQDLENEIAATAMERTKAQDERDISVKKRNTDIEVEAEEKKMAAVNDKLSDALVTLASVTMTESLAENLKIQQNGIFGPQGGIEQLKATVKGTKLEDMLDIVMRKVQDPTA